MSVIYRHSLEGRIDFQILWHSEWKIGARPRRMRRCLGMALCVIMQQIRSNHGVVVMHLALELMVASFYG
jgi:hypothetical protein